MKYRVLIDEDAKNDINETIEWYNLQKMDLGNQFYWEFKEAVVYLKKNPLLFRLHKHNTRKVRISSRFPFFIHFVANESNQTITIFGVLYGGRNPQMWKNRL